MVLSYLWAVKEYLPYSHQTHFGHIFILLANVMRFTKINHLLYDFLLSIRASKRASIIISLYDSLIRLSLTYYGRSGRFEQLSQRHLLQAFEEGFRFKDASQISCDVSRVLTSPIPRFRRVRTVSGSALRDGPLE